MANQLLPELYLKHFHTLPIQYRHIGHLHDEFYSEKMTFDEMAAM